MRYAVIDTELTSLDTRRNRLLSIGAIAMDEGKIRVGDQFYRVVNPGVELPVEGVLVHRLRPNDVEQGSPPVLALKELLEFIEGRVLVGHFLQIDLKVLRKELADEKSEFNNPALDTARVERWILQNGPCQEDLVYQLENIDLATLAKAYNLDFREAHHALDDAFVTARLWQKQLSRLETMGVGSLGDLLRIGKAENRFTR